MVTTDHSQATLAGEHDHSHIEGATRAERKSSFDLADFPVPLGLEEDWRFTPIELLGDVFGEANVVVPAVAASTSILKGEGATVEEVDRDDARLGKVGVPVDRSGVQAWNSMTKAQVVTFAAGTSADQPVHLEVTNAAGQVASSHILIRAQQGAKGIVVIDHKGSGTMLQTLEVDVADEAELTVISIQDWNEDAIHTSAHRAEVGKDSKLRHVVVTLGGKLVRIAPEAEFTKPNGNVEMLGLYFADAGQHQEHRLFVNHAVRDCFSRVTYKGALQGQDAHIVWLGDVLIQAAAEGTDTYEENRNLILSDGTRADSIPNLEIETGEIEGAGHASATSRFDEEQLFYLKSRGVSDIEARRLVVHGFFAELIHQIGVEDVQERLLAAIEEELAETMRALGAK